MYQDSIYKDYKIVYHSSKGMLCVIYYEVFDPEGVKMGEAYSIDDAKNLIDRSIP